MAGPTRPSAQDDPRPVTGTVADEMSDDEIVDLFKNFSLSKPLRIPFDKLDPAYDYRWINKAKPATYQRRRGVGWTPILATELQTFVKAGFKAEDLRMGTHVSPDGFVALGDDLVLARIPIRYAQAIRAHYARINQNRMKAGKNRFHQAGELAGVGTFER